MLKGRSGLNKTESVWTNRFIIAAIAQGAIIVGLTVFLIVGQVSFLKPEVSRVIAEGGAGAWFTFGYIIYIVVGVIGVAVSALFYFYIENVLEKQYNSSKVAKPLAWGHLFLMNIATTVTCGMLMYAGYVAGAAMLPVDVGGKAFNHGQAHEILAPYVVPISAGILVLLLGALLGGMGFLVMYRTKRTDYNVQ